MFQLSKRIGAETCFNLVNRAKEGRWGKGVRKMCPEAFISSGVTDDRPSIGTILQLSVTLIENHKRSQVRAKCPLKGRIAATAPTSGPLSSAPESLRLRPRRRRSCTHFA